MKNIYIELFFLFIFSLVSAEPDCNNPLTDYFSFKKVPLRYKTAEESSHCANLNNKPTCCSQNVFAYGMVGSIDRFSDILDLEALQFNNEYVKEIFIPMVVRLAPHSLIADLYNAAGAYQTFFFPPSGTPVATGDIADKVSNLIEMVQGWYTTLYLKMTATELHSLVDEMMLAQQKCKRYIGKVYANLMCLACDADYASGNIPGVSITQTGSNGNPTITVLNGYCTELAFNCFDYIDKATKVGYINDVYYFSQDTRLSQPLYQFLTQRETEATNIESYMDPLISYPDFQFPPARKPNQCLDATHCPWLCTTVFKKDGTFNRKLFLAGGVPEANWIRPKTPADSELTISPTSSLWKPDLENAGFDFSTMITPMPYVAFGQMLQTGFAPIIIITIIMTFF